MVCGNIFKSLSIPNSQRAEILRECSSHTLSHVSRVTYHVSRVTCHLSHVQKIFYIFFYKKKKKKIYFNHQKKIDKVVELVGEGSVINGAYPVWFCISICTKESNICTPFTHLNVSYLVVLSFLGVAFSFSWAGLLPALAEAGSQVSEKEYIKLDQITLYQITLHQIRLCCFCKCFLVSGHCSHKHESSAN